MTQSLLVSGESQMPLLELLVKCYDADVNLQDKDGYTCLMIAANMGNTLIVEVTRTLCTACVYKIRLEFSQPMTTKTCYLAF